MRPVYDNQNSPASYKQQSILATNTVIRNTYALLSATLLFSAFTAFISLMSGAPPLNPFITLGVYFGLLFAVTGLRNSAWGLVAIFALTGFLGYTLGPILNMYISVYTNGSQLVMTALGLTGSIFLGLSGYALTTRKDFSYMGGFLAVGMVTVFIASLIGLFFPMPLMQLVISCGVVLLMSGYILYETSLIINGGERNYILATLSLYISLYNMFLHLLHILSVFAGRRD